MFVDKKHINIFKFSVEDLTYGQYCIPPQLYSEYGYVVILFVQSNGCTVNRIIYTV